MKLLKVSLAIAVVTMYGCSAFAEDSVQSADKGRTAAPTAFEAAISALGFEQTKSQQAGVLSTLGVGTLVDTTTPFVHAQLNGKRVWRVELAGLKVVEQGAVSDDSLSVRDFTVFVDSASGIVLKAIARGPHYDPQVIRYTSATSAEKDLSCSAEAYTGLPSTSPKIPLSKALERSDIPARLSMEITVDYLVVSYLVGLHKGEHAAWVVNMNGGFIFPGCPPGRSCSHYRVVIDAVTGECLMSTNAPNHPLDN